MFGALNAGVHQFGGMSGTSWEFAFQLFTGLDYDFSDQVSMNVGYRYLNMGGGRNSDEVAAWPTAEVSFMKPEFGAQVVFGVGPDDPEKFKETVEKMSKGTTPYDMAAIYTAQNVIDPRDTRDYLKRTLAVHRLRLTNGVGEHLMRTWPTSY